MSPLARVPVLEDDAGTCLTESAVIALYLERRFPEPRLMPLDRVEHVHEKLGLAEGLIDSAVGVVAYRRFHPESSGAPLVERRLEAIRRTLPRVAAVIRPLMDRPDLGSIALAVALDYLDFRLSELGWREDHDELAAWHRAIAARQSLQATAPDLEAPAF
ncbi:MAG: glutathione S-transferase N-terminal domain-containing protein [Arhodomonas sp.]|nr:glutathione S-transferase N-terminal domain-containing protein [Arhodomonas sp.]